MTSLQLRYAIAYFLVPAGAVMTWSLWWWHRRACVKHVPNAVVLMQSIAWSLLLERILFVSVRHIDGLPSWETLLSMALMTVAQGIHLWMLARHRGAPIPHKRNTDPTPHTHIRRDD